MKFADFQLRLQAALSQSEKITLTETSFAQPELLPSLILAYIGDAVFSLHVRERMLAVESNRVQVLHTLLARMASAPLQAKALKALEDSLTEQEAAVVRRGRNAKTRIPRNASIAEYRSSTALEALLGYLYLSRQEERLDQVLSQVMGSICREMVADAEGGRKDER